MAPKVTSTARVFSQGNLTQTERELDFAIDGNGFFEVERADGTSAFSRDGALKVGPNGEITTSNGLTILNGPNNLPPERTGIFVSPSGLVSVMMPDGTMQEAGQFQLTRFNNAAGLKSSVATFILRRLLAVPPKLVFRMRMVMAGFSRVIWKCLTSMWSKRWSI